MAPSPGAQAERRSLNWVWSAVSGMPIASWRLTVCSSAPSGRITPKASVRYVVVEPSADRQEADGGPIDGLQVEILGIDLIEPPGNAP